MRSKLAETLLARTMNWTAEETSKERPLLQALANFKYDEYQQFSPGIRFMESLVQWLVQFEIPAERKTAYNFIKKHLIFISGDQISHLVNITYADKIQPILIQKTALSIGIDGYRVREIVRSTTYKVALRRSLFIGMSDGSKIDQLRRSYSRISNEQVLTTYAISVDKVQDMIDELKKAKISLKFNTVFLIDDFTASGTSYFRKKGDQWKGKIFKFLKSVFEGGNIDLFQGGEEYLDIHIIFYIATEDALNNLIRNIADFKKENIEYKFNCTIETVQLISNSIKERILQEPNLVALFQKYYDDSINDSHYKEGKHENPYLGYNECALPIILSHNTPNNSLPLLWFPDEQVKGLFPRVKRHKDE